MRTGVVHLGLLLAILLGCDGEDRLGVDAMGGSSGSNGASSDAGAGGAGSHAGGTGGTEQVPGNTGTGHDAGTTDAGGPTVVTFDTSTLTIFALPIGSVRFAASGYDPDARVCASIIWDYSNNGLDVERRCGDFLAYPTIPSSDQFASNFPYVLVEPNRDAPCPQLWDYGGFLPTAASGCIDPFEQLVDARVEVTIDGVDYVIHASNASLP